MSAVDYPYLMTSLIMLLAFTAGALFVPAQRTAMVLSGLLSAPFAFASVIFVPEYWQPKRIACFLTGPEDIIFSFAGGGLVWLTAVRVVGPDMTVALQFGRVVRRYLVCIMSFFASVLAFKYLFSLSTMTSVISGGSVHYVALLLLRRDLFRFSLLTGLTYCVLYTVFGILVSRTWTDFLNQWNWDNLTGLTIVGVPIEESIWALVFAACGVLAMAYILEARPAVGIRPT
jgi:hypothetical protein